MFSNLGENQIKEIINSSKFSIFFIDENQRVTLKDNGSIDEIKKYARYYNAGIHKMELKSQFRCDGSDGYLAWLDNVLEIRGTANFDLDSKYDFKVFDDPNELRKAIEKKIELIINQDLLLDIAGIGLVKVKINLMYMILLYQNIILE